MARDRLLIYTRKTGLSSRLLNFFQSFSISCRSFEEGFELPRSKRLFNVHPFRGKCKPAFRNFCVFLEKKPEVGQWPPPFEPRQNYEYYEYYEYCARIVLVCASPTAANLVCERSRRAKPPRHFEADVRPTFGRKTLPHLTFRVPRAILDFRSRLCGETGGPPFFRHSLSAEREEVCFEPSPLCGGTKGKEFCHGG